MQYFLVGWFLCLISGSYVRTVSTCSCDWNWSFLIFFELIKFMLFPFLFPVSAKICQATSWGWRWWRLWPAAPLRVWSGTQGTRVSDGGSAALAEVLRGRLPGTSEWKTPFLPTAGIPSSCFNIVFFNILMCCCCCLLWVMACCLNMFKRFLGGWHAMAYDGNFAHVRMMIYRGDGWSFKGAAAEWDIIYTLIDSTICVCYFDHYCSTYGYVHMSIYNMQYLWVCLLSVTLAVTSLYNVTSRAALFFICFHPLGPLGDDIPICLWVGDPGVASYRSSFGKKHMVLLCFA